jgi:flagellar protein FliO/FliZ
VTLLKTFLVLGIVLGLIYVTLNYGVRRLMGVRSPVRGLHVVQLVQKLPLDPKHSVYVLKAAGEYLLVGGGEGSMSLLGKLTPEQVEQLTREQPKATPGGSPFLQKLLSRRGGPPPSA